MFAYIDVCKLCALLNVLYSKGSKNQNILSTVMTRVGARGIAKLLNKPPRPADSAVKTTPRCSPIFGGEPLHIDHNGFNCPEDYLKKKNVPLLAHQLQHVNSKEAAPCSVPRVL